MTITEYAQNVVDENPDLIIQGGLNYALAQAYLEQREILRQIGFTAEQSALFGQSDTLKFIAARAKEALKEIE